MNFDDYTPSQQDAITKSGKNIIVSAGAGSGKTQVLTERVVYFIKNKGYKLKDFLLLTFTNLAAGEMKDRIRSALKEEGLDEAQEVDTANISTFDSYALSIVKKYHFELKVSPHVSMVDSNIIAVRKRTIIDEIFEDFYKEKDPIFASMIKRYCFKNDKDIKNLVLKFYDAANLQIDTRKYLDNFIENYYNDKLYENCLSLIFQILKEQRNEIKEYVKLLPTALISKKDDRPYKQAVEELLTDYLIAETYEDLVKSIPEKIPFSLPQKLGKEIGKINDKFKEKVAKAYEYANGLPMTVAGFKQYFKDTIPYAEKLIEIINILDERIIKYKEKYQVFEFQDIAKKALKLVKENEEVKNSISNSLKMIMIDEYQDTSLLQESFVNEIANNNVYMVGDVKQSIYRFRNARSDIFIEKYRKYKNNDGGIAIDLTANFRSKKEVLDDINYIFKQIMTEECGGAEYRSEHVIEYGNTKYLKAGYKESSTNLDFLVYEPTNSSEVPEKEAHLIARDIINKINNKFEVMDKETKKARECTFSDFCILMDRGTSFPIYSKIFSEYQLPLYVENDENISSNEVILVLTNIIRLIKSIKEKNYRSKEFLKAFLSVARSFLFKLSDNEIYEICKNKSFKDSVVMKQLSEVVYFNSHLSIAELLQTIMFKLDFYTKCISIGDVKKNEKYLDMFFEMFKSMSNLDYSLDDFIMFMEYVDDYELKITLTASGSSIDSVKIMNIHKSKGLEFNIVYFAGLKKQFNRKDLENQFGVSSPYGLIFAPEKLKNVNILKDLNAEYEIQEDTSEKIRLFYVSLTRTKEKMIFLLPSNEYDKYKCIANEMLYNEYLRKNKLDLNNVNDSFVHIYNSLLNNDINQTVFEMLIDYIGFELPFNYYMLDAKEKNALTAQDILSLKEKEKAEEQKVKNIVDNLINEYKYPVLVLKNAANLYVSSELTASELNTIAKYLSKEISEKFFDEFDKKGTAELKDQWIFDLESEKQNPFANKEAKFEEAIHNALDLYYKETITYAELIRFMSVLRYSFTDDAIECLSCKKPLSSHLNEIEYIINNPIYDYDKDNVDNEFINIIKEMVNSSKLTNNEALRVIYIYNNYPYFDEIKLLLMKVYDKKVSLATISKFFELIGYDLTDSGKELFEQLDLNTISSNKLSVIIDNLEKEFASLFELNNNLFEYMNVVENFKHEKLCIKLFGLFKKEIINLELFKELLDCINFEITKHFEILTKEQKLSKKESEIDDIVVERGLFLRMEDLKVLKSFYHFICFVTDYRKFKKYTLDTTVNITLEKEKAKISYVNLNVKPLTIPCKEKVIYRASKELTLNANKKHMDFGTKVHLVMELMDFKNPDYSILEDFYANIVKNFLSSSLMNNIRNGNIYKEYEFYDEDNTTNGIIDLMVVYDDHIDIIDYKTKNIDDESYDKQLEVYEKYISNKFNKPVNTYLYSLLTSEVKQCK